MSDKHNNSISVFVYISILINIIVLALFITFVFGLKKDAFDVDTKKLDRNALICQNSIVSLVQDYDARLNKIVESYPFINLLQQVILNGIDENEKERIISIFRSGNYPFDTVALYLADGKPVFSSPVKTKPVDLESYKKSEAKAFFDKDYDGVYFVKPIRNDRGIEVGYIVASVFKKIFENTSYNLNFVVLPNGVVYYNSSIDINSISRDSLTQYMNKEVGSSETIEVDNNTFTFYSSKVKDIDNFNIGILELNVPIIQKYLKYIILALLGLSFIFLLITSLIEKNRENKEDDNSNADEEDIYDKSEPLENNYANANIVNDEEFNIDDYDNDIEPLDNDSIKFFNRDKKERITRENKVDLPKIDDVEDIEVEENDDNDIPSLDDILEDGGERTQDEEDDADENIKLDDMSSLDDNLTEDFDEIPNLDDIIDEDKEDDLEELSNMEETPEDIEELHKLDGVDQDEDSNIEDTIDDLEDIPSLDDVLDENNEDNNEEQEENKEDKDSNIEDTIDDLEDIPSLDDVLGENEEENNEEQEENKEDEDSNIEDTIDDLEDIPSLDDVLGENNEENDEDTIENLEDIHDNNESNEENIDNNTDEDELEETIDNSEEKNKNNEEIIKGIDDIIDDEGDILISHGSILEDEIAKKEEEYFSSSDAFNFSLNRDFLLGDYDDEENSNSENSSLSHSFAEDYDDGEVIKPANEKDSFDTEDLIDKDLYDPEEVPKIPDDYYREAEEKVKENMTAGWKNVLKALKGKKFVNKNMNDMLDWVKEQSGLDILHAAMLTRQEDGSYNITESQNISDSTKNKLNITENEALFKKILADPFSSDSLKTKFDFKDRENISHMIFVPVENDEGGLKSFFIGLSAN